MDRIRIPILEYLRKGLPQAAVCIAASTYLLLGSPQSAQALSGGCGELWDCNIEQCQDPLWTCQGHFPGCLITVAECGASCPGGGGTGLHCVAQ